MSFAADLRTAFQFVIENPVSEQQEDKLIDVSFKADARTMVNLMTAISYARGTFIKAVKEIQDAIAEGTVDNSAELQEAIVRNLDAQQRLADVQVEMMQSLVAVSA